MGHRNSNKVLVPRVVSMVEETIIVSRRPHAQKVTPRQWHIPKEVLLLGKSFREGVSPDMTGGIRGEQNVTGADLTDRR